MSLTGKKRQQAEIIYLVLAAMFITSLVTSNLIFQKFFSWSPFGLYTFELSVGIIAYPVTFLVTDIISEIYGRRMANRVVLAGVFASGFALLIVLVASMANATEWSPLSDAEFDKTFSYTFIAVSASLAAYLLAQFLDVQIFHFWKRVTKGRHLWLRNNFSTFASQLVDTMVIIGLLCSFGVIDWELFVPLVVNGFLFKVLFAAVDTPIAYVLVYFIRRHFGLKGVGAEINLTQEG